MKGIAGYELKNGYYQNRLKMLIGVGVLVFISYIVIENCMILYGSGISTGDCWLYLFSGNPEYKYSSDAEFELPILWFLFHAYMLFMLCSYPVNDLKKSGIQSMLFSQNRKKWCISKLLWTIAGVAGFYCMELGILAVEMFIQSNISGRKMIIDLKSDIIGSEWGIMFILPIISDMAIAVFQMMISLYSSYFLAYIASLVYLILSVYIKTEFMLGNYSMLLRSLIFDIDGLSIRKGILVSLCFIVVSSWLCVINIRKRDIFDKGLEI